MSNKKFREMEMMTLTQFAERFGTTRQNVSAKTKSKRAQKSGTIIQNGNEYRFQRLGRNTCVFFIDDIPVEHVESRKLYQRKHSVE